ncbi:hypothetical protein [Alteripontixanthobacter muriae]|uniref:hypothetical protein n=1 Tax=Alteripontixanthobacter muriae TaxID=2705546 RepID=UPI001E4B34FF|nr:hypothetical protein [Alteripontixanthobacter muriae]
MVAGSRMRQLGWAVVLGICLAVFAALTFRVNAVKSEVRLAERQIIALQRETILLETEFETRANQQQLADWNVVDFGYEAPRADQYVDNERELAALAGPRAVGAPDPIRVARAADDEALLAEGLPAMVSPVTGRPAGQEQADRDESRTLAERLTHGGTFSTRGMGLGASVLENGQ